MQLDVEESIPASACHDLLISLKNKKLAIVILNAINFGQIGIVIFCPV